ncbi:MAG: hypothetical protein MUE65_04225 [Methanomassiliicoccales archaeon]|nr:hypothetical protein [Methanomassiliicoccales archaeon]
MEDMTARAQALSEMAVALQRTAAQFRIDDAPEVPALENRQRAARPAEAKKASASKGEVRMPSKVKEALSKRGIEA